MAQKNGKHENGNANIFSALNALKDVAHLPADVVREVLHRTTAPLRTEFRPKDLLQIIIGASILAVPVAFTEETWSLGGSLPLSNVLILGGVSLVFIGAFVYYNYYRNKFARHWAEYVKRVISTYLFSLAVVAGLLTIIQVAPWSQDFLLALKRVIIVAFPASMSAVVADTIK
ncbi:MAG: DUF2391 family protein [Patescibacteria group bacterium]|nr:DUF2391 family protein [bacterium]MDZ4221633.1 DUF2391 family protein [Patescibacteria group bacterium]